MNYFIINSFLFLIICTFCASLNETEKSTNITTRYYKIPTTTEPYSLLKPSLKKNLVLYGLDLIERDAQHLKRLVYDILVLEAKASELQFTDMQYVYRLIPKDKLESYKNSSRKTPILLRFRTEEVREMVLKHRNNLNPILYRLEIDKSKRSLHKNRDLNPLRSKIQRLGMDCRIFNGKLYVNNKLCSEEQIDRLMEKAHLKTTSSSLKPGFVIKTRASLTWRK